jgi:EAL domain-containing protein (putative c-di-GMP-specific phosphodiesterase class I)/CheY-like chemotaxis protein
MNVIETSAVLQGSVLLVDDDPEVLRAWRRTLERVGCDVHALSDSSVVPELLRSRRFDAIVSDVRMAGMDGFAVLRAARECCPGTPVLLATGDGDLGSAIAAVEGGAFRFLLKPVHRTTLESAVAEAFRARAASEAGERSPRLHSGARPRRALEATFERALSKRWLAFQPLVDARSNAVVAYEALLRTAEPGLVRPPDFLAAARQLGRLLDVGRAVRADAAAAVRRLPEHVDLFVNVDAAELEDPELYDPCAPLSTVARRVVLEITERASLESVRDVALRTRTLREMGYRIALDDLGAGFAALSAFVTLRPDVVKIDMSLVRGIDEDRVRRRIVDLVVQASHELGTRVVAEGVETAGERAALVNLEVDLLQGYLIGRPLRMFGELQEHAAPEELVA